MHKITMTERTKLFVTLLEEMEKKRPRMFRDLQDHMLQIQEKKGRDYGEEDDGLKNLRRRGEQGVIMRMGDKLSRLESLTAPNRVPLVTDESVDDTLIDLANYCLLLIILRNEKEAPRL